MAKYWLMKSEEDVYPLSQLEADGSTCWEGVRNYQARNFMRDDMKLGDKVLFYHSNAKPPGVTGIAEVVKESYPDHYAFDESSPYFDPKSDPDKPRWMMVDVGFVEAFADKVALAELKAEEALDGMYVIRRGMRLSVQPVEREHFEHVVAMGRAKSKD